jgi:hypothetical protein
MVGSEIIHAKLKGHTRTEVLAAYGIKEVWPPVPPTLPPPPKLPKWLKLWRRFQSWQLKKRQLIMHRKEMEALHFRITQLKGPDLEVNRLVGEFLGWKDVHHDPISDVNRGLHPVTGYRHVLPDFTGSYDDAIASFPKEYRPSFGEKDDDVFTAYGHAKTEGPCLINYASSGKTGPTAILSVSIRIRIEQLDHQP